MDERKKIKDYFIQKGSLPAEFGEEAMEKAKAEAEERKSGLGTAQFLGGIGDAIAGRSSTARAQEFDSIRKGIDENTVGALDKQRKDFMTDTAFTNQQKDFETKQAKSDPNSAASQAFRKAIEANFPAVAKQYGDSWKDVSADDQESLFKPLQLRETIESRKEQMRILSGDKALARADRKELEKEKSIERALKVKDASAAQAKQAGLYSMGMTAEKQFNDAIKDKDKYDPTGSGQWIDNSSWAPNMFKNDKAIEAQNAKDAWIEAFLRDASGAAIAQSERAAYGDIYFPSPGDTADVVKNKTAMRQQKMEAAAGGAGRLGQSLAAEQAPAPVQPAQTESVRMRGPKGNIKLVPRHQVEAAIKAGATPVDSVAGQ